MSHVKKQENMPQSKEENKMSETIPKEGQALDAPNKDFKTTVLNMSKELKENTKKQRKSAKQYINKIRMTTKR